ncbi:MAG: type II CAAX prenyl endopeptidase Rce1 family protein [Haloquadratum sp.]
MDLTPVTAVGLGVALAGFELLDRTRRALGGAAEAEAETETETAAETETVGRPNDLREHAWKWAIPAALLWVVVLEGNSLASIGWRLTSWERFAWEVGIGATVMVGVHLLSAPVWARVGDGGESLAAGIGSFASLSLPERLFVAGTAGVTEETAFHGYAIERLLALTGSAPLAGGVAFVAFTLGHAGDTWDRNAVARIAQPALVMTFLYLWFRSLPVLIVIHVLNDAVGLLLADRHAPDGDAPSASENGVASSTDGSSAVRWLRGE